jgi:hypothetical protein
MTPARLTLLSLLIFPGCVVHTDHAHRGTLTLDWTVDGTDDPAQCRQGDVDRFSVHVETSDGAFADDYDAPCEAFSISIDLPADDYHADAVLIDSRGRDATTTVPTDDFRVHSGEEVVLDLDFPADSFL